MALSFTVVTSFMASAVQVNAQGAAVSGHEHLIRIVHSVWYEGANSEYHFVYCDVSEVCSCGYSKFVETKQIGYEQHDLRGGAPGAYRLYCIDCNYME